MTNDTTTTAILTNNTTSSSSLTDISYTSASLADSSSTDVSLSLIGFDATWAEADFVWSDGLAWFTYSDSETLT
jgi:hypothetical protein